MRNTMRCVFVCDKHMDEWDNHSVMLCWVDWWLVWLIDWSDLIESVVSDLTCLILIVEWIHLLIVYKCSSVEWVGWLSSMSCLTEMTDLVIWLRPSTGICWFCLWDWFSACMVLTGWLYFVWVKRLGLFVLIWMDWFAWNGWSIGLVDWCIDWLVGWLN